MGGEHAARQLALQGDQGERVAEQVVQVAGEAQPFLVGGELGDGGAGLAQRDGGPDQFAHAGHREAAQQRREQQCGDEGGPARHHQRQRGEQRRGARDRPAGQPRRQGGAGGDRDVHEQDQPLAAQAEGEDRGLGREDGEGAEDEAGPVAAPGAEDQQHVPDHEAEQAEPAEDLDAHGVTAVQQVVDGGAQVGQPDGGPHDLDGLLPAVLRALPDADAVHAFSVSFRYSQAAPPVKSTKETARTARSCACGA